MPSLGAVRVPGIRNFGLLSVKKVGALTVGDTGDLGVPTGLPGFLMDQTHRIPGDPSRSLGSLKSSAL